MKTIISPSSTNPTAKDKLETILHELLAVPYLTDNKDVLRRADCLFVEMAHDLYLHSQGREIDLNDRALFYDCQIWGLWGII